jgi:hypothetical protein
MLRPDFIRTALCAGVALVVMVAVVPACTSTDSGCLLTTCGSACVDLQSDPKNCGVCGHICVGNCSAGICEATQIFAAPSSAIHSIAYAAGAAFVATRDGSILHVSLADGAATTLAAGRDTPSCIVSDADRVYWTEGTSSAAASIVSVSRSGGDPTVVVSGTAYADWSTTNERCLASDGTNLFFIAASTAALMRVPAVGGATTQVAVLTANPYGYALTLDATAAYVLGVNEIVAVQLAGGATKTLVTFSSSSSSYDSIAIDGRTLWWVANGAINRVDTGGGTPGVLRTPRSVRGFGFDDASVYWVDVEVDYKGSVYKQARTGTTPSAIARVDEVSFGVPGGVHVEGGDVYWATTGGMSGRSADGGQDNGGIFKAPNPP